MSPPKDCLLNLDLSAIGLLNEAAFAKAITAPASSSYTLCFWFLAGELVGTKIIANLGNQTLAQQGWTVYLQGSSLNFRVNLGGKISVQQSTVLETGSGWQHFVGSVNQTSGQIRAYLDGVAESWAEETPEELVEPGAVDENEQLLIGGYTDSAGGHFNYRFGETPTELVDDFRLYSRALNLSEIQSFMAKGDIALEARFTAKQDSQAQAVYFDADNSVGNNLTYLWDFGDGSSAQGKQVEHTYTHSDEFKVTLSVFDQFHRDASLSKCFEFAGETDLPEKTPVFTNGKEGYACFRIPAIVQATNGDLIAFAEGRVKGCSDATQVIHIVSKRSKDDGKSWSPLQVVARNFVIDDDYACMNPSPVVDTVHGTGRIIVVYNKMETSEWAITRGQGVARVFCIASYDHGETWTGERNITLQVHKPYNPKYVGVYKDAALPENEAFDWRKQVPTLGHALQLKGTSENPSTRGRLFFVGCRTEGGESVFYTQNYAFWSDDLGENWQLGATIDLREGGASARGLNEATAVELSNGAVIVNSRNYQDGKGVGVRAVTVGTFDKEGELSFGEVQHDGALTDSGVQASLVSCPSDSGDVLLFANPAHPKTRKGMTVRLSEDAGKTWRLEKLIDPGSSAYSDLVVLANGDIGLLYEQGNHGGIVFTSFSYDWLTD